MMQLLFDTAVTTVRDVLPIAVVILGFQLGVLRRPIPHLRRVLTGFAYVLAGLALFLVGLEQALFPLGKLMAAQLTAPAFVQGEGWWHYGWIYAFGAAVGFAAAIAEPALIAVALKANAVSGGAISVRGLRVAVALGAGIGIAVGCFRIVTGTPLHWYIIAAYLLLMLQTAFAPRSIIPLAYDSGGVTTSTVTVPLVTALGLGLAANLPGRDPLLDGFGLIATTCLFPIATVLGYAQLSHWRAQRFAREKAGGKALTTKDMKDTEQPEKVGALE